jgi:hypothetical protein
LRGAIKFQAAKRVPNQCRFCGERLHMERNSNRLTPQ